MEQRILAQTEPVEVFRYFEDLTRIPRESGNEAAVCAYLVEFAKAHGPGVPHRRGPQHPDAPSRRQGL